MRHPVCNICHQPILRVRDCIVCFQTGENAFVRICHRECAMKVRGKKWRAASFGHYDRLERWYGLFKSREQREIGLLMHRWVNERTYRNQKRDFVQAVQPGEKVFRKNERVAG